MLVIDMASGAIHRSMPDVDDAERDRLLTIVNDTWVDTRAKHAEMIARFDGRHEFLSNFAPSPLTINGIEFPTVEHAFAAFKTTDLEQRRAIAAAPTPGKAKRMGRNVQLRPGWNDLRIDVMRRLIRLKFAIPGLREKLAATAGCVLIEGTTWRDTFWGIDLTTRRGANHLGLLLMERRSVILVAGNNEHRAAASSLII